MGITTRISIFLLLWMGWGASAWAQHPNVFSLFVPHQKNADKAFENGNYLNASKHYKVLVGLDSNNVDNLIKLALSLNEIHKIQEAEYYFQLALKKKPLENKDLEAYIEVLHKNEKYSEVHKLSKQNYNSKNNRFEINLTQQNYSNLKRDSLSFSIKPVPFNSEFSDFSPSYGPDGLLYVSNRERVTPFKYISNRDSTNFFDLYYVRTGKKDTYGPPYLLRKKSNTFFHEGPSVYSPDKREVIVTKNNPKSNLSVGKQTLGIYFADWDSLEYRLVFKDFLPFNSPDYSVGQPSISPDGQRLYFVSDMPGGLGGKDIYVSRKEKNQWGTPSNIGEPFNSPYDEMFPFFDGEKLYFSSDRPGGLGGLDIYVTYNSKRSKIKNLGYPMNSFADDFGIVIDSSGKKGYFSSNRGPNGIKDDDIYSFKQNEVTVKIVTKDKLTQKPIPKALIITKSFGNEPDSMYTDSLGRAIDKLKPGYTYNVIAIKSGYREINNTISTKAYTTSGVLNAAFNFDRRYKSYVNVSVSDNETEEPIPFAKVYIFNLSQKKLDTLTTDKEGKGLLEVDNENNYSIICFSRNRIGVEKLSTKKIGKYSKILFLYPKLDPGFATLVDLKTVDADSLKPLPYTKIAIKDNTIGFQFDVESDSSGRVPFYAFPGHQYVILSRNSFRKSEDLSFVPKGKPKDELILKLKNKYDEEPKETTGSSSTNKDAKKD